MTASTPQHIPPVLAPLPGGRGPDGSLLITAMEYLGMIAALAILVLVFSLRTEHFFSAMTFQMLASQVPDTVIAAVGMTFVMIVGGIDLSVGSVLALTSAVIGVGMAQRGFSAAESVAAGLYVGLCCGLINGAVSVVWRLPAFIVTLGMLEVARGAAFWVTGSRTQYIGAPIEGIAGSALALPLGLLTLRIPAPFLIAVAVVVLGQLLLSCTVFGRYVVAIGTNEEAVRLSGIDPRPTKVAVFVLCGGLTALAAVIQTSRLASANPNAGGGFELQVIAAAVIGGTSLMGGRGSVVRTFFGVLIIAVLGAGLAQVGAQEHTKRIITGAVIVAAVILDHYRQRLRRDRG